MNTTTAMHSVYNMFSSIEIMVLVADITIATVESSFRNVVSKQKMVRWTMSRIVVVRLIYHRHKAKETKLV
jgi:hypothetical protein